MRTALTERTKSSAANSTKSFVLFSYMPNCNGQPYILNTCVLDSTPVIRFELLRGHHPLTRIASAKEDYTLRKTPEIVEIAFKQHIQYAKKLDDLCNARQEPDAGFFSR